MDEFDLAKETIKNSQEIQHNKELFAQMVQRLEEKVDDLKSSVNKGFSTVNNRLDGLEKNLDKKIDERIVLNEKTHSHNFMKWFVGSILGALAITVATNFIMKFL